MRNEKKYMSTAEAGVELGLSITTVQKLVTSGELEAIRTGGGHRRIFVDSIDRYKKMSGPRTRSVRNLICIMHEGDDLDPLLIESKNANEIQFISHPLDLLDISKGIDSLFIDARSHWVSNTSVSLMGKLQREYNIFVYNADKNQEIKNHLDVGWINLIPGNIDGKYISGYRAARTTKKSMSIQ
jgi:excisionase family DNA binding protein